VSQEDIAQVISPYIYNNEEYQLIFVNAPGSGLLTAFQNGVTIYLNVNVSVTNEAVFTTPTSTPTPSFVWNLPGGSLTLNGGYGVLYIGSTSPTVGDYPYYGIPAPSSGGGGNIVYSLYSFSGGYTGAAVYQFNQQFVNDPESVPYIFTYLNEMSNGGILTATQNGVTASIGLTINATGSAVLTMF
jgi:hypothetical protein